MIQIIDVFGQFDSKGTDHYYIYPQQALNQSGKRHFLDPRSDLATFCAEEFFSTFCTNEGWWIAITKRNIHDSRQGYAMLSLCLGDNRPADGAQAIKVLRDAHEMFVTERQWDDQVAFNWTHHTNIDLIPCAQKQFTMPKELKDYNNAAYRTYKTQEELDLAMTYIAQDGYSRFSSVFMVPQEAVVGESKRMHDITKQIPIRRELKIIPSWDCEVSLLTAFEGDTITITYHKNGQTSDPIMYKVGSQSEYATTDFNKNEVNINSAPKAQVSFYKHIRIQATDHMGHSLTGITLLDRNPYIRFDDQKQELIVSESMPGKVSVSLRCRGYEDCKVKSDDLMRCDNSLSIRFKPKKIQAEIKIEGNYYQIAYEFSKEEADGLIKSGLAQRITGSKIELICKQKIKSPSMVAKTMQCLGAIFSVLIVVGLIYGLAYAVSGGDLWPFEKENSSTSAPTNEESIENDYHAGMSMDQSEDEESDIDYLKKHDSWDGTALKSDKYKDLIEQLKTGNIDVIISKSSVCFTEDARTNGHWKKIIEILKEISYDPELKQKATDEIKRICSSGTFSLSELQTALKGLENKQQSVEPTDITTPVPTPTHDAPTPSKPKESKPKKAENPKANKGTTNKKQSAQSNGKGGNEDLRKGD